MGSEKCRVTVIMEVSERDNLIESAKENGFESMSAYIKWLIRRENQAAPDREKLH